jgi:hypothetical protein
VDTVKNFGSIFRRRANLRKIGRLGMTKTIAKVILMTMLASAAVACATAPEKAPITRKG